MVVMDIDNNQDTRDAELIAVLSSRPNMEASGTTDTISNPLGWTELSQAMAMATSVTNWPLTRSACLTSGN